jgi:hypothetical protein
MVLKLNQFEISFRLSALFYSVFWRLFIPTFGNMLLHLKLNNHDMDLNFYTTAKSNLNSSGKVR